MLDELNPIIRGWGNYYRRAKVRRLYHRLNRWIVLRLWNHQHKHWRNAGWRDLPERRLYGELGLLLLNTPPSNTTSSTPSSPPPKSASHRFRRSPTGSPPERPK